MNKHLTIIIFVLMASFSACNNSTSTSLEQFNIDLYKPQYANGFAIKSAEGLESTILEIYNPWQGAKDVTTRLFIGRGDESVPSGFEGQILDKKAERFVCMSSSHVAMLDFSGNIQNVVGVSGLDFINNDYISANGDSVMDVGYDNSINYEALVALDADIVLLYGVNAASSLEAKLQELGICYAYIGDYLEQSPLGKAEWVVALSQMADSRDYALEKFSLIPEKYAAQKARLQNLNSDAKPKVMLNAPYRDSWFMPDGDNYLVRLINDAGGEYVYKSEGGANRSDVIDIEQAYLLATKADLWLHAGSATSIAQLRSLYPKFKDVECVTKGEVYNCTKRVNARGGNDYWESGIMFPDLILKDLISIFHAELSGDEPLYYYQKL